VVVCDGRKAIVMENTGDAKFPNLQVRETYNHPDKTTAEQGAEKPGRVQHSVGRTISAVGQTDWHDESERAFLAKLADRLHHAVSAGEVAAVILVAPPRALGMIREKYSPALRKALTAEIAKDLVKAPTSEIEKHLTS
jgi:protein required for attachment to host cells